MKLHPDSHHAWLIRRVDQIYMIIDGPNNNDIGQSRREALQDELKQKSNELRRIEK